MKWGQWHRRCDTAIGYCGPSTNCSKRESSVSRWCSDLWWLKLWKAKPNILVILHYDPVNFQNKLKVDCLHCARERQNKPEKNSGRVERHGPQAVTTPETPGRFQNVTCQSLGFLPPEGRMLGSQIILLLKVYNSMNSQSQVLGQNDLWQCCPMEMQRKLHIQCELFS